MRAEIPYWRNIEEKPEYLRIELIRDDVCLIVISMNDERGEQTFYVELKDWQAIARLFEQ